ncbi:MAG: hypothetical protein WBA12_14665 [Catalinimonas sp.]
MKRPLVCLLLLLPLVGHAGGDDPPVGGRTWGLAGAGATLRDVWSVFNNPGGLAGVEQVTAGLFFENRFQQASFSTAALAVAVPLGERWGHGGLHFRHFGDALYREQEAGVSYGHRLGEVTLGAQAVYHQVSVDELGGRGVLAFNFGGVASVVPKLHFGAAVSNLNQARLVRDTDERLPTVLRAGVAWEPTERVWLTAETEKDVDAPALYRVGLAYRVADLVEVRTGFSSDPAVGYFGAGLQRRRFGLDYAVSTHPALGWSHHLSLQYTLDRRDAE